MKLKFCFTIFVLIFSTLIAKSQEHPQQMASTMIQMGNIPFQIASQSGMDRFASMLPGSATNDAEGHF